MADNTYYQLARAIVDSDPVISTYAACEWDELSDDGKLWITEIVRQAMASRFHDDTAEGSLTYRKSWPRSASPCALVPLWAGEFRDENDWISFATQRLTGITGTFGADASPICVDALGRRCLIGADFRRAREEGAYPVRYFFECVPA